MDDLLELLFDLLGWAIPLIGKFWFVILGYLGYKLLGLKGNKSRIKNPLPARCLHQRMAADGRGSKSRKKGGPSHRLSLDLKRHLLWKAAYRLRGGKSRSIW